MKTYLAVMWTVDVDKILNEIEMKTATYACD